MSAITIAADSPLVGLPVGALDVTVAAIRTASSIDALPAPARLLEPDDIVYAIGRIDALRSVDAVARDVAPTAGAVTAPPEIENEGSDADGRNTT